MRGEGVKGKKGGLPAKGSEKKIKKNGRRKIRKAHEEN